MEAKLRLYGPHGLGKSIDFDYCYHHRVRMMSVEHLIYISEPLTALDFRICPLVKFEFHSRPIRSHIFAVNSRLRPHNRGLWEIETLRFLDSNPESQKLHV